MNSFQGIYGQYFNAMLPKFSQLLVEFTNDLNKFSENEKRTEYYLFGGYASIATLLTYPYITALLTNASPIELTYGGFAFIGMHSILFLLYRHIRKIYNIHRIWDFIESKVVPMLTVGLVSGVIESLNSNTSRQRENNEANESNNEIPAFVHSNFASMNRPFGESNQEIPTSIHSNFEIIMSAICGDAEEMTVNEAPEDAITHQELPNESIVFVLDECTTSLITQSTLDNLMEELIIKNPFTNLPIRQVRKYKLRIVNE